MQAQRTLHSAESTAVSLNRMRHNALESGKESCKEGKTRRKRNLGYMGPVKLLAYEMQIAKDHVGKVRIQPL